MRRRRSLHSFVIFMLDTVHGQRIHRLQHRPRAAPTRIHLPKNYHYLLGIADCVLRGRQHLGDQQPSFNTGMVIEITNATSMLQYSCQRAAQHCETLK
jgi:hypothetical protein